MFFLRKKNEKRRALTLLYDLIVIDTTGQVNSSLSLLKQHLSVGCIDDIRSSGNARMLGSQSIEYL